MDTAGEVLVRAIEPPDAEQVALLSAQLGYSRPADAVRRWIEQLTSRSSEQCAFVACVGGAICGWIEVSVQRRIQSEAFALIGGLVVKQDLRGRGIGRLLCAHAEQWSRKRQLSRMRVTSRSTRADAHRFYLNAGFLPTKTSEVFEKALNT